MGRHLIPRVRSANHVMQGLKATRTRLLANHAIQVGENRITSVMNAKVDFMPSLLVSVVSVTGVRQGPIVSLIRCCQRRTGGRLFRALASTFLGPMLKRAMHA